MEKPVTSPYRADRAARPTRAAAAKPAPIATRLRIDGADSRARPINHRSVAAMRQDDAFSPILFRIPRYAPTMRTTDSFTPSIVPGHPILREVLGGTR